MVVVVEMLVMQQELSQAETVETVERLDAVSDRAAEPDDGALIEVATGAEAFPPISRSIPDAM